MQTSARWASEDSFAGCCFLRAPTLAWQWEGRSCRTKASKALLRLSSSALMSHMNSVHPYFIASHHCLSFLLPHPEQVGTEVWFAVPGHRTPPEWSHSSLPHLCLCLISFIYLLCSQSYSSSSIVSCNAVSILLLPCSDSAVFVSVSFSLGFPHRLYLPDKEKGCPFMCFP